MPKNETLKERVAKLEAIVEERTKTLFNKCDEILKEIKSLHQSTSQQIQTFSNHLSTLTKRVEQIESGQLTKTEKWKVYATVVSSLIAAIAAIVVALLK
jgi:exonuclease VII small subunit